MELSVLQTSKMPYVGIRCTYDEFDLRRDLLLFDRLALPLLEVTIDTWTNRMWADPRKGEQAKRRAAELQWLAEKEVIFAPSTESLETGTGPEAEDYREYARLQTQAEADLTPLFNFVQLRKLRVVTDRDMAAAIAAYMDETGDEDVLTRLDEVTRISYDSLARALAAQLSTNRGIRAIPIMSTKSHYEGVASSSRADVLTIALNTIPFPSSGTPLEKILEFRSDPDVRADFLAFHRWASQTASRSDRPGEIVEEIEYLLAQYDKHMRLHRIEQSTGAFEAVVTVAAEALEDLVKFNWGAAAKLLFSLRKRNIALLKAEMGAPGRELAYLVKAAAAVSEMEP